MFHTCNNTNIALGSAAPPQSVFNQIDQLRGRIDLVEAQFHLLNGPRETKDADKGNGSLIDLLDQIERIEKTFMESLGAHASCELFSLENA